ncbi:MAG: Telomerase protein component 1 [Geoglossum simile]|nr:MAG: Telomerase protein component 1 [Geoglossum simile]
MGSKRTHLTTRQASILRQIVAGPRSRHPEAGLDLCYVTDSIVATSGPSSTYPQLAYRNPLDSLVKFLDEKHGDNWAIWEFRAEGTGYPDEEVYGRIWHYPFPDHHPPPFALVPNIMASMRNWLIGNSDRVVVVHCKAGKGRSGTISCAYLISECGWAPADALSRFTERRMRPGFGQGVSIPSQLRWIDYVTQWTKNGKTYVERSVEVLELHVWGLRDGVKASIEGYVEEGKTIKIFHVFKRNERTIVDAGGDGNGGKARVGSECDSKGDIGSDDPKPGAALGVNDIGGDLMPLIEYESPGSETGGDAVIFRPKTRIVLPTNDINIDFERRNRAGYGWTMVTSVAHVWFNAFFEGSITNGTTPPNSGIFEIEWDKMDGIKGSPRKGIRALDRLAVVWKVFEDGSREVIKEPGIGEVVNQVTPADWRGAGGNNKKLLGKDLGLRSETPASADISKASSVSGGDPEPSTDAKVEVREELQDLPQPAADAPVPNMEDLSLGLDAASYTTPLDNNASGGSSKLESNYAISSGDALPSPLRGEVNGSDTGTSTASVAAAS